MMCPWCETDAPMNHQQWQDRRRMVHMGKIVVPPCKVCRGTEYFDTDKLLIPKGRPPRSLLARLLDWFSFRRSMWKE